ncbi:MAG TPA: hypothetical protein VF657_10270 [Actinoplanes sp.]|jgi:hypothetical protein
MTDLPPGGGSRLRGLYLRFLVLSVVASLIVLSFAFFATASATGDDDIVTLLVGCVVITTSSVCLVIALLRGRGAVHGDRADIPAAVRSRLVARMGSLVGWLGALAVVAVAVVQHVQHVDMALLEGIVLAGGALIPAVGNDAAKRLAGQMTERAR